ncbi:hypothetical protein Cs7R123_01220 [Catellatospora sp. TT07R-123]|uniref:hypothetical protein n=1 Tax=Catellatospora sp. TT07R-123 TaxID=2733863 RepID=UPI001B0D6C20|nr:hypothetical protein [Catellatospora sp. TT07R-123]GHJ42780.1 hypothetical protein Cs7R123_01220 [Catellatospora sp. TT07R-123]
MKVKIWAVRAAAMLLAAAAGATAAGASADAAVPDRFGFALWSGGVVSQAVPAGTSVTPGVPGRWTVKFPGQGIVGGVVHVTAVHDALTSPNGRFCQAESWGPDTSLPPNEIVRVACYRTTGVLDPAPGFSVQFARSSGGIGGGLYGYMHNNAGCGIIDNYTTLGFGTTCAHVGVGQYSIAFTGLGTPGPQDGGIQVTAVNPGAAARCKVASMQSSANGQFFRILCFNHLGALADNAFTSTYQYKRSLYGPAFPPNRFGYIWNVPGAGPATTNYNSVAGGNGLGAGPPVWTIKYYSLAASLPGNSQATAYGTSSSFCGLHRPWSAAGTDILVTVNCFDNAGNPINSGFFSSYSSQA